MLLTSNPWAYLKEFNLRPRTQGYTNCKLLFVRYGRSTQLFQMWNVGISVCFKALQTQDVFAHEIYIISDHKPLLPLFSGPSDKIQYDLSRWNSAWSIYTSTVDRTSALTFHISCLIEVQSRSDNLVIIPLHLKSLMFDILDWTSTRHEMWNVKA